MTTPAPAPVAVSPATAPAAAAPGSAIDFMAEFHAGVTAALRSWSALRTAVEGDWGGIDTKSKAEDLRTNILEQFDASGKPKMDVHDLEDNLAGYMEEEFSVVLEDGSERQLAEVIFRMYENCGRGDVALARQVVANAQAAQAAMAGQKVVVQTEGEMDEDDDDDDGNNNVAAAASASAAAAMSAQQMAVSYASEGLFGPIPEAHKPAANAPPPRQLGEAAPEKKPQVEVDDDGFAAVAPRRSRRGR